MKKTPLLTVIFTARRGAFIQRECSMFNFTNFYFFLVRPIKRNGTRAPIILPAVAADFEDTIN